MTRTHDPQPEDGETDESRQRHQTRQDGHSHSHAHSHARLHHTHNRLRNSPNPRDVSELEDKAPHNPAPQPPVDKQHNNGAHYYTHVIQTLSLIYGTDQDGNPSIRTIAGPPATIVVDSQTGETIAAIPDQDVAVSPPAPAPEPVASEAPQSEVPVTEPAPVTTSITPQGPHADSSTASVKSSDLTSAPSPTASTASMDHHHHNATNTPLEVHSPMHSKTNTTMLKAFDFTTTPFDLTTTSRSTIISHTTLSSFLSSSTVTAVPSSTEVVEGGGNSGGSVDQGQPTAGPDTNNETLSPREKQIVGGVVGSVAGAAFFILLVMLALRYKKRKQAHLALEDNDGPMGRRAIAQGGGSGGPAMSQRSSMPAAVAAAMASLTGRRDPPPQPVPEGERGFYRVSGRKLQSVLQTGGDGYTDPHNSMASGTSDYYRGSQAFDRGEGPSHLTLGSPMRPVSGVMVMRDGPGRTPVTEQNPFVDPPSPPPSRGPGTLGRSLPSQDGSGASGSRFRERI
ncbi:hypothetical protein NLU13_9341 [Sarocladium strictum]|uniref:Uncharacterized protein n=1 Tax=Sarocladium strictum TaxID=5046 RepID=A0AA39G9Z3_SARSR|nr:hypothetical protein NLU13_9341 [Sarocladium strictum]